MELQRKKTTIKKHKDQSGITLVALVVTIIILIILAGVSINLTIGEKGIISIAKQAKENLELAQIEEAEKLNELYTQLGIDGMGGLDYDAIANLDEFKKVIAEAITSKGVPTSPTDSKETMAENIKKIEGSSTGGGSTGGDSTGDIVQDSVKVGDYVAYDPTAGVTDTSKLQYTSPVGTGTSHGNGYTDIASGQSYKATNDTKWRVLSKDETTGEIILISESTVEKETGGNFNVKGAIGYLYFEQELNEICKIYGYGKGANTAKTFTYEVGDVGEGVSRGTITGSGARSINVNDINRIIGFNETETGKSYSHTIFHPTTKRATGISNTAEQRTDRTTAWYYTASDYITNTSSEIYKMLFRNVENTQDSSYWIASRAVSATTNNVYYEVGKVIRRRCRMS